MKLTNKAAEFEPGPVAPQPVLEGPLAALLEWQAVGNDNRCPRIKVFVHAN